MSDQSQEPCFLVKDVGDIVRKAGSDAQYMVVAIDDDMAWVKHEATGTSNLEPLENLIFVRSVTGEDFYPTPPALAGSELAELSMHHNPTMDHMPWAKDLSRTCNYLGGGNVR